MSFLSKDQVKQIIQQAPPGTSPGQVVQGLVQRGFTLEGYNDNQPQSMAPQAIPQSPLLGAAGGEQKKSVGGFLGNVVGSGANFVKNTAEAVIHPIKTVEALGKTALGAAEKLVPGQQGAEQDFNQLTGFFKQRYGSFGALKNTIYNDPVGFAADLSAVLGGAGAALKGAGTAAEVLGAGRTGIGVAGLENAGSAISKVGGIATRASEFTNPLTAPTEIAKAAIPEKLLSSTAQRLYQSALKPSTTLSDTERANILLTGLKEGIPVSKAGAEQLGNTLDELNGKIAGQIASAAKEGKTVSTSVVTSYLDEAKQFAQKTLDPNPLLKQIDDLEQGFLDHPLAQNGELPIDVAQEIKQNTYTLLRKSYGEMKSTVVEAQKALARGIKEEIVRQVPEVGKLNARETSILQLDKQLERAVGRINNRDIIGLGTEGAAAVGGVAGGKIGSIVAGLAKQLIDTPEIKSKLAIILQKASENVPTRAGKVRRVLLPTGRLIQAKKDTKE